MIISWKCNKIEIKMRLQKQFYSYWIPLTLIVSTNSSFLQKHENKIFKFDFKAITSSCLIICWKYFPCFLFRRSFLKSVNHFFIVALSNNLQSNKQRHTDIQITGPAEHYIIKWGQLYLVGNNLPSLDSNRVIVRTYIN